MCIKKVKCKGYRANLYPFKIYGGITMLEISDECKDIIFLKRKEVES